MVTHVSLFIKESAKHIQNTSNADLETDVILAMMWKEDVRGKKEFGWCLFGKNF